MPVITVVSPCYQEEDNVEICHETVRRIFEETLPGYTREHIFADNASTDGTLEKLRQIAQADPAVKVIVNARNFGLFRSTFNAFRYATGDAILLMLPVDLQDPPEMLPDFVKLWEQGYQVVAGARLERQEGAIMRACRRLFYAIVNKLADFEIPENVGEFQLVDRKVLDAMIGHEDQYPYIRGLVASVGFRRVIVPYTWVTRERGKSKLRIWTLVDQALNGIFAFTSAPMRLATLAGFTLSALCVAYAIAMLVAYFVLPNAAPRGITTLLVSLFFLSGVQIAFIGMLGEYVTAIHAQVRHGGVVTEQERINIDRPDTPGGPPPK
ncbi:glycosyltransferase family 2 protein [Croceibacterium sp. LX-88]|jgi:glycosyltransferase involved in cell wall biosynthesis|uniref:Glycosyltransferase family 2 protein n=1 Tax=Croceibacterium selenioxidans TaxID=2838833 RepID=A0ABS5W6K9_9SPHN|nr:glycosyltransferase family 2 protein [Croceibacterium selenioxidans]MBT2134992.1 glycosyltransferase family 2 protein [Croceibacterium selenioxidans]